MSVLWSHSSHRITCTQEEKFIAGIASGYELAERNTQDIILSGAVADRPETEYGWDPAGDPPQTALAIDERV